MAMVSNPGTAERADTLPSSGSVDLSLASSFIPLELFASIMGHITQIDRSLFGMNSQFDSARSVLSPVDMAGFASGSSPINSSASYADCTVVQPVDFA